MLQSAAFHHGLHSLLMQKTVSTGRSRVSYMSAHVLLNLLNELGKRDEMQGLPSIFLFFATSLMKKVNKQCLLDTPRTVRVSEKTWQVIVQTRRP